MRKISVRNHEGLVQSLEERGQLNPPMSWTGDLLWPRVWIGCASIKWRFLFGVCSSCVECSDNDARNKHGVCCLKYLWTQAVASWQAHRHRQDKTLTRCPSCTIWACWRLSVGEMVEYICIQDSVWSLLLEKECFISPWFNMLLMDPESTVALCKIQFRISYAKW